MPLRTQPAVPNQVSSVSRQDLKIGLHDIEQVSAVTLSTLEQMVDLLTEHSEAIRSLESRVRSLEAA